MKTLNVSRLALRAALFACLVLAALPLAAQAPRVAVMGIENASGDPGKDYLGAMVSGLLSYDLSSLGQVQLLERKALDKVLHETEIILNMGREEDAAKFGGLAGADYLVTGSYSLAGGEVEISLNLVKVSDGTARAFRERGSTENSIHALAEKLAAALGAGGASFQEPGRERSMLSLKDETPGSIALYSPIIDAEIFVDDQFVGYTTGKPTEPFLIESVSPGKRTVRVHLDKAFGVAVLPAYTFKDWSAIVTVQPGRKAVARDETRQISDILHYAADLHSQRVRAAFTDIAALGASKSLSYQDLAGKVIAVSASATPKAGSSAGNVVFDCILDVDGKQASFRLVSEKGQDDDLEQTAKVGEVSLHISISRSGDTIAYWFEIKRHDLEKLAPRQP